MPTITNQHTYRECYEAADPDQAYANLAVIASVAHDLQAGSSRRRQEARLALQTGVLAFWLDVLDLGDVPRRRVERLLEDLAG